MTHRENFHRMMRGEPYGWVPLDLPMTPPVQDELLRQRGTRDAVEAFDLGFRQFGVGPSGRGELWRQAYADLGIEIRPDASVGNYGHVDNPPRKGSTGEAYHLTEMVHPLESLTSLETIQALPWHDLDDPSILAPVPDAVERIHAEGRVAVLALECTVFELAWYLRGMDYLFMDLVEENGIGDWLLDRFMEQSKRAARAAAEAGADLIRLGDDVGTQRGMMMSVPFWRRHLKPRLAQVVEACRPPSGPRPWVQYHSDGDIRAIVEDLIEIGIDIINPVQPECMPLDEVVSRWKDRLAFSGMIGTQTTMPFGRPSDVREAVAKVLQWAERGARLIVAPTHVLEPDVHWENIEALYAALPQRERSRA